MAIDSNAALYPEYKKDTRLVAQWLDATSKAYGFIASRRKQPPPPPAGVKKQQHTIRIADFERMADFLSLKESVSVPSYVRSSLSRAIRYRTTYGNYLQLQRRADAPEDKAKDKNHLYFIDVLRNVRSILNRTFKPDAPAAPSTQTAQAGARFANLSVHYSATVEDDVEDDAPAPQRASGPPASLEHDVVFEPWEEDEEEALFQWRLFNMDVQRIRQQIRQLWEAYRANRLNLSGVATAHNMAIHLVRKMEEDIHPVFKRWGGYLELSTTHFVRRYVGTGVDAEQREARLARVQADGQVSLALTVDAIIDGFDIAEEEMVFAWQVLASEIWAWRPCGAFGSYNGKWGPFIPRDDRHNMTSMQKYMQDKAMACGVVHDVQILAIFLNRIVGMQLDELSTAVEDLVPWRVEDVRKKHNKLFPSCRDKITFRAVFATQLLLDSAHVLGTSIDRPCKELLDKVARIYKSVKSLREFYEGRGAPALGPLPGPSYVEIIETAAKFWQGEDPIAEFRRGNLLEVPTSTETACALLRHDAPLCGWWMQTVQAGYNHRSITIANSISLPLACARLYYAFVQEGLVPKGSWPDMDAFSTLHRGDLWVGTAPKSGQYLYNLMLAGGNSIVGLASDARNRSPAIRPERVRYLTGGAKVSMKVFDAFVDRGAEGLGAEDLERLMTDTKLRWYDGKAVGPCFHHGWDKAGNHKGDGNATCAEMDNPFLRLAQAIDAETLEQSFDYMSLNRVCWMVLRELMKKGRPILDAIGGPDSAKPAWETAEGSGARMVVTYIFMMLFLPDGTVNRKEASAIAGILLDLMRALGRVVHTSTGIDWTQALECTCDEIPSS
ncbi:hypothetical protein F5Y14DRAFT_443764 [Nemania sp. NC0429]|nr:hypothetical protein F5Y14DRAFT_443764 [Nemania sp. NC0429]